MERKTYQKTSGDTLQLQLKRIQTNNMLVQTLDGMNIMVLIMNSSREIVYGNESFVKSVGCASTQEILGIKPGDLLKCRFSTLDKQGCGYSQQCESCAMNHLVVEVMNKGVVAEGDTSMTSIINGINVTLNFNERVTELVFENEKYYMVALRDVSADVDKQNLQRIFFHDIMNTASGLYNAIRLLRLEKDAFKDNPEFKLIEGYVKDIIDDIEYQRSVVQAESNKLEIEKSNVDIRILIDECSRLFGPNRIYEEILIEEGIILSDRVILRRIIINLLKNALEASDEHEIIEIRVVEDLDTIRIQVHNESVIPISIRENIFAKGNSSKGKGRGLGVYGSKLLMNRYLKGDLVFESTDVGGTTFSIIMPKEVINEDSNC